MGNPDLAYQYVHDNIETLPVQGSLKGPVGAMLDGRGTALDQAELMALVLRVNGVTAAVEYGTRTLSQAEATNWLGVSDTSVIPNILSAGGFTTTYPSLDWAWVAVTVNGTTTYYDPASKAYVQDFGLGRGTAAVESAFGISPAQLKTHAEVGATITTASGGVPGTIKNLNYGKVRTDLITWSNTMLQNVRSTYPISSTTNIIGGKTITAAPVLTAGAHYGQASEIGSPTNSFDPEGPSNTLPLRQTLTLALPGQSPITFASSDLYGRELYVYYDSASGTTTAPELWLEGQTRSSTDPTPVALQIGTSVPIAAGQKGSLAFTVCYPGSSASLEDYTGQFQFRNLVPGNTFSILNQWGPVGRGMAERQRRLLEAARGAAAGTTPAAGTPYDPLVRSLTTLGFSWGAQRGRIIDVVSRASDTIVGEDNVLGVVGLTPSGSQYTPYFDIGYRQNILPPLSANSDSPDKAASAAQVLTLAGSMLEASVLEQTQPGMSAVSTTKLFGLAAQPGQPQSNTFYDLNNNPLGTQTVAQLNASCNQIYSYYVSTLRPMLVTQGYGVTDLQTFDTRVGGGSQTSPTTLSAPGSYTNKCSFSSSGSSVVAFSDGRVVLPASGSLTLGAWPDTNTDTAYQLTGSAYLILGQVVQSDPLQNGASYAGIAGTYLSGGLDNGAGAAVAGTIFGEATGAGGNAVPGGPAPAASGAGREDPGGGSMVNITPGSGAAGIGVVPGGTSPGSTGLNANIAVTVNASPLDPSQSIPGGGGGGRGTWSIQQGNFTASASDISVGTGDFPYALTLTRSYDSNQYRQNGPFPATGWTHNFIERALQDSDMFESLGVNSPVSGAAGIATLYAAVDLLSSPDARLPSMENILIASMMANWLGRVDGFNEHQAARETDDG